MINFKFKTKKTIKNSAENSRLQLGRLQRSIFCNLIFVFCFFGVFNFVDAATVNTTNKDTLRNGLVGHWTMDGKDVVNGVLQDKSGNGNNGNMVNIATSTFYTVGKIGQAFKFDGVNDYVKTGSTVNFGGTKIITASFWLNQDAYNSVDTLAMELSTNFNDNDGTFVIDPNRSAGDFGVAIQDSVGSGKYRSEAFTRPSAKTWHHYSIIFDNSTVTGDIIVYIDNVLQSTTISTNTKDKSTAFKTDTLYFMTRAGTSLFNNASIDDVRIYDRALSASEIQQLYNLGAGDKINTTTKGVSATGLNSGLAGHWTMDGKDVVNGVLKDKSGNGNNGQLVNIATSTFYTLGKIGQAFKFDGVDDYKKIGDINENLNSLSVFAWVKTTNSPDNGVIVGHYQTTTNNRSWLMQLGNPTWGAVTSDFGVVFSSDGTVGNTTAKYVSGANLKNGKWQHVGFTWNGTTLILYQNGVAKNATTYQSFASSFFNSNASVSIGGVNPDTGGVNFFGGSIDDTRIYNRTLSASEIQQLYNLGAGDKINTTTKGVSATGLNSGLAGHWTMDGKDVVSGVLQDKSGNGNSGQLVNIATSTFYTVGKIGQAFKFDGVNDYVTKSNSNSLKPSLPLTVSAWVKVNSFNGTVPASIMGDNNTNYYGYFITVNSTGGLGLQYGDGTGNGSLDRRSKITSSGAIMLGRWYHVAGIIRGATDMTLYINGVDAGGTYSGSGGAMAYTTGPTEIGRYLPGGVTYYNSSLFDDVRIYNRALSASEIKQLYNMGR